VKIRVLPNLILFHITYTALRGGISIYIYHMAGNLQQSQQFTSTQQPFTAHDSPRPRRHGSATPLLTGSLSPSGASSVGKRPYAVPEEPCCCCAELPLAPVTGRPRSALCMLCLARRSEVTEHHGASSPTCLACQQEPSKVRHGSVTSGGGWNQAPSCEQPHARTIWSIKSCAPTAKRHHLDTRTCHMMLYRASERGMDSSDTTECSAGKQGFRRAQSAKYTPRAGLSGFAKRLCATKKRQTTARACHRSW